MSISISFEKEKFNAFKVSGAEALFCPYRFNVHVLDPSGKFDPRQYILSRCQLNLKGRIICGIITEIRQILLDDSGAVELIIKLEPRLAQAKNNSNVRVILNQSVPDIVTAQLLKLDYEEYEIKWQLEKEYARKPYRMQLPLETDLEFCQRLLATAGIWYWIDTAEDVVHFSDNNAFSPYAKEAVNYYPKSGLYKAESGIYELCQNSDQSLAAVSDLELLQAGHSIVFNAAAFGSKVSGDYLVAGVEHEVEQKVEHWGKDVPYKNRLKLQPRNVPFEPILPKAPLVPTIMQAHIESAGEYPQLDEVGNYFLKQRFDLSEKPNASASPPIKRLAPFPGWHMPLRAGAEVLVSLIDGDPDRPIILGTVPNMDEISPVTSNNSAQNILRSASGTELLMDDTKGNEKIELNTPNRRQQLTLSAADSKHEIDFVNRKGAINWQAKKDIQIKIDQSVNETIAEDRAQTTGAANKLQTQNGDIESESKQNQSFYVQDNLRLQAEEDIEINSGDNFHLTAGDNINISADGQQFCCQIKQGDFIAEAAEEIKVTGKGNGILEIGQPDSCIRITPDGTIEIWADDISALAENNITINGQVDFISEDTDKTALVDIPELQSAKDSNKKVHYKYYIVNNSGFKQLLAFGFVNVLEDAMVDFNLADGFETERWAPNSEADEGQIMKTGIAGYSSDILEFAYQESLKKQLLDELHNQQKQIAAKMPKEGGVLLVVGYWLLNNGINEQLQLQYVHLLGPGLQYESLITDFINGPSIVETPPKSAKWRFLFVWVEKY